MFTGLYDIVRRERFTLKMDAFNLLFIQDGYSALFIMFTMSKVNKCGVWWEPRCIIFDFQIRRNTKNMEAFYS